VLVGEDDKPEHPYIVDFESEFDAQYKNYLGYQWLDGRLKVVLHKDVPKIAPILAKRVLDRLLPRNNLDMAHINHLIVHPGGVKVLDNLRDELGIPDEKLAYSREILRVGGNVSSACVGAIGKLVRQKAEIGDYGLVLAMGAGFSTAAMVLFWRGAAGPGLAWPGTARQGEAGLGKARPGAAWPGEARRGGAR
jgi:alkylresorcinol/alkylpyrone synthase